MTADDKTIVEYIYDPTGLRLMKTKGISTTQYAFDLAGNQIYDTAGGQEHCYVWAFGKTLARVDGDKDSTVKYFFHTDMLGSTVLVTGDGGKIVWTGDVTPFGEKVNGEGILEGAARFTGKEYDEDTGMFYFNARWYDPELGRFVEEDTYRGAFNAPQSLNLYTYCLGNPLVYEDPTGHAPTIKVTPFSLDDTYCMTYTDLGGTKQFTLFYIPRYYRYQPGKELQSGRDVDVIQHMLIWAGLLSEAQLAFANEQNKFGPATEAAVMQFQQAAHLTMDGTVGPQTLSALIVTASYMQGCTVESVAWQWNNLFGKRLFEQPADTTDHSNKTTARLQNWRRDLFGETQKAYEARLWSMAMQFAPEIAMAGCIIWYKGGSARIADALLQRLFPARTVAGITPGRVSIGWTVGKTAVIRRNMKTRVEPYAEAIGAETFKPSAKAEALAANRDYSLMLKENREWVQKLIEQGYTVIDLGLDPEFTSVGNYDKGQFYSMETQMLFGDE